MDQVMKRKLPIGMESFETIRKDGFYYIDKTGMIEELLQNWGQVNLFTRPRRFGKSLNMSMLKSFFEIGSKEELFYGLKIAEKKELCEAYMGKFPVISISMKGIDGDSFETARSMLCSVIGNEAVRFQFLLESGNLTDIDKRMYRALLPDRNGNFSMTDAVLIQSIQSLSSLLWKHYGQKTVILIDEYDVPLAKAFEKGYYDSMLTLIRLLFTQALKTNSSLYFAVLTGCLRIAKESVFTGLNNISTYSVTDNGFDKYFGFTDAEVRRLLEAYHLSDSYQTIRDWYDGYRFGNTEVYSPWDVLCYCSQLRTDRNAEPEDYWSNTSNNDMVRRFLELAKGSIAKKEIEQLIAGETVTKEIRPDLTYQELYGSIEHMWSVLLKTGYLTCREKSGRNVYHLAIPNMEIRELFIRQVIGHFEDTVRRDGAALDVFCTALQHGNAEMAGTCFQTYLKKTISIRDTFVRKTAKENFYHGILLGILGMKEGWNVSSNKEAGDGYSDILVEIERENIGIVIEVKYAEDGDLEKGCKTALAQIEEKQYAEILWDAGMEKVVKYGIACCRKRCRIEAAEGVG